MSAHLVTARGMVACKGTPGAAVNWREVDTTKAPPADLLEWSTLAGAQKFAAMHEGEVTTRLDLFYSPRELTT